MSKNTVINLKTDPKLKEKATEVANRLGVSISAVLNNELRRFSTEESVVFATPEIPNKATSKAMVRSKREISKGEYLSFKTNKEAVDFLRSK